MGKYINPGNDGFRRIRNGKYTDKSGMIALINKTIDTSQNLSCITRPRRFGKSFAAQMLAAYYDSSCDSSCLFDDLEIADINENDGGGFSCMGRYNVLCLDISGFLSESSEQDSSQADIVSDIRNAVIGEIRLEWPEAEKKESLQDTLLSAVTCTGKKFIVIIDEWDAIFRERPYATDTQRAYINLLRGVFKNINVTAKAIAAVIMTGILPIKKYGTESAMSDFIEYTMLDPGPFAPYVGFTGKEVRQLCGQYGMDYDCMKSWYDGYAIGDESSVYNPASVMQAVTRKKYKNYWAASGTYESLKEYIDMDFDGLQSAVLQMLGGNSIRVNVDTFQNDMTSMRSSDDILALLAHLGYVVYDEDKRTVCIPNKEIQKVFADSVRAGKHTKSAQLLLRSDQLIQDTINMEEQRVADAISFAHDIGCAPIYYNDEQALRAVVKSAYFTWVDHFIKFEELPSGHGYADIIFFPRKNSQYPILLIELKWNKSTEGAIAQIRKNQYPQGLREYGAPVLLVGINYDSATKEHQCRIEKL